MSRAARRGGWTAMGRSLHRSMFGQMMILTIVFIGAGVYLFAVQPLMNLPVSPQLDPLRATSQSVTDAIGRFVIDRRDGRETPAPDTLPVLRAVRAANPDFRYFVRIGDDRWGDADGARFFREFGFDRLTRILADADDGSGRTCTQGEAPVVSGPTHGYYSYYNCGTPQYYEYSGLSVPVRSNNSMVAQGYQAWIWRYSGGFVYAVLGIFAIYAGILLVNMRMIRRVAATAQSFDPGQVRRQLPEKGLPIEVLPLVRATNHMLARLEEAQGRRKFFFSAAAHEMRTPLTVLRARLELLDDGPVKDKLVEDVRRLVTLVNRLLTLMRVDGHGDLDDLVDLAAVCRAAVAEQEGVATAAGVVLRAVAGPDAFEVLGDESLIRTALANLIGNAISFSPRGGTVTVALDAEGRVSVRDEGPGVPDTGAETLFEPFVRLSHDRNGYGLGLAIVRAVTDLHKGDVSVTNAPEGGALFVATFGARVEADG